MCHVYTWSFVMGSLPVQLCPYAMQYHITAIKRWWYWQGMNWYNVPVVCWQNKTWCQTTLVWETKICDALCKSFTHLLFSSLLIHSSTLWKKDTYPIYRYIDCADQSRHNKVRQKNFVWRFQSSCVRQCWQNPLLCWLTLPAIDQKWISVKLKYHCIETSASEESCLLEKDGSKRYTNYTLKWSLPDTSFLIKLSELLT